MKYETLVNVMETIKPGTWTRMTYKTELPVLSEWRKAGYRIIKTTTMTTRFKIKYSNINGVNINNSNKRRSPYTTVVPNLFSKCNNNYYISTYPCSNRASTSTYTVVLPGGKSIKLDSRVKFECYKHMVTPSYWTKSDTKMMRINVNNVVKIGNN